MKTIYQTVLITMLFIAGLTTSTEAQTGVYVNGKEMPLAYQQTMEQYYQMKIQKGRYWYDATCGLWGLEGGPALGIILPNLQLGGSLRADASRGRTGIYINGRQIDYTEQLQWQQLVGPITRGRYWLDAYGNVGLEGGPALVNLIQLAQQSYSGYAGQGNNGNSFYRNFYTGNGGGGNSEGFYIMGRDWSYSSF